MPAPLFLSPCHHITQLTFSSVLSLASVLRSLLLSSFPVLSQVLSHARSKWYFSIISLPLILYVLFCPDCPPCHLLISYPFPPLLASHSLGNIGFNNQHNHSALSPLSTQGPLCSLCLQTWVFASFYRVFLPGTVFPNLCLFRSCPLFMTGWDLYLSSLWLQVITLRSLKLRASTFLSSYMSLLCFPSILSPLLKTLMTCW